LPRPYLPPCLYSLDGPVFQPDKEDRTTAIIESELAILARFARAFQPLLGCLRADRTSRLPHCESARSSRPMSINDIASTLGLEGSTITRQVAALEKKEQVGRRSDPADRRSSCDLLDGPGRQQMSKIQAGRMERITDMFSYWSGQERDELAEMLVKLNEAVLRRYISSDDLNLAMVRPPVGLGRERPDHARRRSRLNRASRRGALGRCATRVQRMSPARPRPGVLVPVRDRPAAGSGGLTKNLYITEN